MSYYHSCQQRQGLWVGVEFYLSLISGRDVSSQQELIKKKGRTGQFISEMNTVQLSVMKRHILGHCFNSWCTLLTYAGSWSPAPRGRSVFTHHPPPATYFLFFRNFCLCSWFLQDSHVEIVLMPKLNQLPIRFLLHPQLCPHLVLILLPSMHWNRDRNISSQRLANITQFLQTTDWLLCCRTPVNKPWVFFLSEKKH